MKMHKRRPPTTGVPRAGETAEIRFDGGRIVVSAGTPYERELALEHAEYLAHCHGSVHVELDGKTWVIRFDPERRFLVWGRRRKSGDPAAPLRLAVPA